jgi:hypothetical protein
MRWIVATALLVALAACGRDDDGNGRDTPPPSGPTPSGYMDPATWRIGPVIGGQNYSHGMPSRPATTDGWSFAFPRCTTDGGGPAGRGQSVNYLTTPPRALPVSGTMSITYEIRGTGEIAGTETGPPRLRMHFQRRGDNWSGTGAYNAYRWFSRPQTAGALTPGTHTVSVPLTFDQWGAVQTVPTQAQFDAARQDASAVGFTFGSQGAGHGVCMRSGTARFVLRAFSVR